MPFESLSYRYVLRAGDFPQRWLPLVFLYDPDLPLFPISYFHVLAENWVSGSRPGYSDRTFGYIERVNPADDQLEVHLVCNKDLRHASNQRFLSPVSQAVRGRLGLSDPVTLNDVANAFTGPMANANQVLVEIWHRVVGSAYGDRLPFGQLWDPVLGLARCVASWRSPGGRKGELIQTHYFAVTFGETIQSAGGIPQTDFHLFPTFEELTDISNPLNLFPAFRSLCDVAMQFDQNHFHRVKVGGLSLSAFRRSTPGSLNAEKLSTLFNQLPHHIRGAATECFNAFDKGAPRTVIYLLMLADIRSGRLPPANLTPSQCGAFYTRLGGTYQSPKTIQIYAQQAHGNTAAMPRDTWVNTFLKWPLALYPTGTGDIEQVFSNSTNLGKVERLVWAAAQARKVHSSACDDALWCIKYGDEAGGKPRGANPLACRICLSSIRRVCPAYAAISDQTITFNARGRGRGQFDIETSAGNNTMPAQTFVRCTGYGSYEGIIDEFSPVDEPSSFAPYPQTGHNGSPLTVAQFVDLY